MAKKETEEIIPSKVIIRYDIGQIIVYVPLHVIYSGTDSPSLLPAEKEAAKVLKAARIPRGIKATFLATRKGHDKEKPCKVFKYKIV